MSEEVAAQAAEVDAPAEAGAADVAVPAEGAQGAQNAADQAPADTPAEKSEETPEQAEKRREGRRVGRRLDAAYRRAAEQQARADLLERQLNELKPKATQDSGAPKLENYSDIEEYATAKAEYAKAQANKEREAAQQSETQKRHVEALTNAWEEKTLRADGKYDDFDEIVGDIKPMNPLMVAIMDAENGEDVAYYLGKNPGEFKRIAALNQIGQIREIGKLEAKLLAEPPKPKTPSKAPAPISPLGGKSSASSSEPSDTDDIETWMKKANAKDRARAGA
jgi:hypothetical protein